MTITSDAFESGGLVPAAYTCDGEGLTPPLAFDDIPENTKSLALIMEDPDAPGGTFTHLVLYNIGPGTTQFAAGQATSAGDLGQNELGEASYIAPCPPSGTHHYIFRLFALDTTLELPEGATRTTLLAAMDGHVIESAELASVYSQHS